MKFSISTSKVLEIVRAIAAGEFLADEDSSHPAAHHLAFALDEGHDPVLRRYIDMSYCDIMMSMLPYVTDFRFSDATHDVYDISVSVPRNFTDAKGEIVINALEQAAALKIVARILWAAGEPELARARDDMATLYLHNCLSALEIPPAITPSYF